MVKRMTTINVRFLSDDLVRELKLRAARNDRTLDAEVCQILKDAAREDLSTRKAEFLARVDSLRKASEGRPQTPAETLIREDRDFGH